jgi:hypothetical protein
MRTASKCCPIKAAIIALNERTERAGTIAIIKGMEQGKVAEACDLVHRAEIVRTSLVCCSIKVAVGCLQQWRLGVSAVG